MSGERSQELVGGLAQEIRKRGLELLRPFLHTYRPNYPSSQGVWALVMALEPVILQYLKTSPVVKGAFQSLKVRFPGIWSRLNMGGAQSKLEGTKLNLTGWNPANNVEYRITLQPIFNSRSLSPAVWPVLIRGVFESSQRRFYSSSLGVLDFFSGREIERALVEVFQELLESI